ncbi:hypothetical protein U1Q18_026958 [Sarracenia purpurea var. burkii]
MRGRQRDAYSTYKRLSSRDHINSHDREDGLGRLQNGRGKETENPSWKHSLPHVLVASLSSFLYGYHLGVVNGTLESISMDLGFNGSTIAEGLVVSACLGGAFVGSLFSGWIADGVGRRRAFQLCALPMIAGASMREIVGKPRGIKPEKPQKSNHSCEMQSKRSLELWLRVDNEGLDRSTMRTRVSTPSGRCEPEG